MVGADLRNLVNEAALLAARRDHDRVTQADFTEALEKIVLGARAQDHALARRSASAPPTTSPATRCWGCSRPGADPVRKVSIMPRGRALGVTFQRPDADRYGYSVEYLRGRIVGALGGRAAEEVVYGDITTGAESDLEQATADRPPDGRPLGDVRSHRPGQRCSPAPPASGQLFPGTGPPSPQTLELLDSEVRRIMDESRDDRPRAPRQHRERLDDLAHALLEHETLDEADAYRIAGIPRLTDPPVAEAAPPPVATPDA